MNLTEENRYHLQPGYIFVTSQPYIITTILGSCVAVCLLDRVKKIGGMNHYIYDVPGEDEPKPIYGSISIPYMIKLLQEKGARMTKLEAFVAGGASSNTMSSSRVGENNVNIAKKILREKNINIKRIDVNGDTGRKITFNTFTGNLNISMLKKSGKEFWYG